MALQQVPKTLTGTAVVGAAGTAEVQLGSVPAGCSWRNVSIQVKSTSASFSHATVYKGITNSASNQLDDTGDAGGNSNTSATAWVIPAGEPLRVVWTGATVGSTVSATCQVVQTFGATSR